MDVFHDIAEFLDVVEVSTEISQAYLDQPYSANDADCDLLAPVASADVFVDAIRKIKTIPVDELGDIGTSGYIKKLGAASLSTINGTTDANAVLAATRFLFLLCSLPGASACGVSGNNVLTTIASNLMKVSVDELKEKVSKSSAAAAAVVNKAKRTNGRKKAAADDDDEGDDNNDVNSDTEDPSSQPQLAASQLSQSQEDPFADDEAAAGVPANGLSSRRRMMTVRPSAAGIRSLLIDMKRSMNMFADRTDDHPLECIIDALTATSYLSAVKPEFSGIADGVHECLVALSVHSERALIAVYRSILPSLTMAGRDLRLPDSSRARAQCHKAAVQIVLALVRNSSDMMSTWGVTAALAAIAHANDSITDEAAAAAAASTATAAAGGSKEAAGEEEEEEEEEEETKEEGEDNNKNNNGDTTSRGAAAAKGGSKRKSSKKAEEEAKKIALEQIAEKKRKAAAAAMPLPFASIVGALQRMVVSSPERAPVRASLLASILEVLSCLHEQSAISAAEEVDEEEEAVVSVNDNTEEAIRQQHSTAGTTSTATTTTIASISVLARQAIVHFLQFLGKLSKSSKIAHRAYSLDIATAVLAVEWVWNLESESTPAVAGVDVSMAGSSPSMSPADGDDGQSMVIDNDDNSPATNRSRRQSINTNSSTTPAAAAAAATSTKSGAKAGAAGGAKAVAADGSSTSSGRFGERGPRSLLSMVLGRCDDSAPTVRMRAIGAFCGLLEKLRDFGHDCPRGMIESMLDLALTGLSASDGLGRRDSDFAGGATRGGNLLDILRIRTDDEKPLVRAKAIQAFGTALSLQWPKYVPDPSLDMSLAGAYHFCSKDTVSMLITEEDVSVFFDHCGDLSLAARKQALTSLTELVVSRPADASLQEAWVAAALPLATDPESSVQQKLAQCAHDLLVTSAFQWGKDRAQNDKAKRAGSRHRPGDGDAVVAKSDLNVWRICDRIASTGRAKLLRSCVSTMVKQSLLSTGERQTRQLASPSSNAGNILNVVEAVKIACCCGLQNQLAAEQQDKEDNSQGENHEGDGASLDESLGTMDYESSSPIRDDDGRRVTGTKSSSEPTAEDAAMISRGAWVLLEALISQDNLPGQNGSLTASSLAANEEGSADFVIECFMQRHSSKKTSRKTGFDEDDVRILHVLEKLAHGVSANDSASIREVLLKSLKDMNSEPQGVSAAIAVLFALSKAAARAGTLPPSKQTANNGCMTDEELEATACYGDVQHWAGELLHVVHTMLHVAVWGSAPEADEGLFGVLPSSLPIGIRVALVNAFPQHLSTAAGDSSISFSAILNTTSDSAILGNSSTTNDISSTSAAAPAGGVSLSTKAGRELVLSALFMLGEIALLGFSVEEDEAVSSLMSSPNAQGNVPGVPTYTVSEISKAFKLVIPPPLITLSQVLMDTSLPDVASVAMSQCLSQSMSLSQLQMSQTDDSIADTSSSLLINGSSIVMGGGGGARRTHSASDGARRTPSVIRAHAFVTMGKLCLRNKDRAREHVNIFLRELSMTGNTTAAAAAAGGGSATPYSGGGASNNSDKNNNSNNPAVRSNALLVLGDLCVRYTNLVDRHVGIMASCLQDPNVLVRKHALVLLTQLILQDYLKWRGMLLFRFIATAVDSDPEMCEFAKTVLKKTLHTKYPDFFAQHFAESVIVFNGCSDHPAYVAAANSGAEGGSCAVTMEGVDLEGNSRRNKRLRVYAMMMEDFTEEQKIQVTAKLVQDILSHAVDAHSSGLMRNHNNAAAPGFDSPVAKGNTPFEDALEDAFLILQSPLLKVGRKGGNNADGSSGAAGEEEDDDLDVLDATSQDASKGKAAAAAAMQKAKTRVLKKLSLQHLMSHILPVVTSLKHSLEACKSPLQRALMEYLVMLTKAHKNEVAQALSTDPTLKAEIEYDLRMFEKAKEKAALERQALEMAQQSALETANMGSGPVSPHTTARPTGRKGGRVSICPNTTTVGGTGTGLRRLSYEDPKVADRDRRRSSLGGDRVGSSSSSIGSILRPALRKSLGGPDSRGRTPRDAIFSATKACLPSSLLSLSAAAAAVGVRRGGGNGLDDVVGNGDDGEEDLADRLLCGGGSGGGGAGGVGGRNNSTSRGNGIKGSISGSSGDGYASGYNSADEDHHHHHQQQQQQVSTRPRPLAGGKGSRNKAANTSVLSYAATAVDRDSRRRSWSVVVDNLDNNSSRSDDVIGDDDRESFTPLKKRDRKHAAAAVDTKKVATTDKQQQQQQSEKAAAKKGAMKKVTKKGKTTKKAKEEEESEEESEDQDGSDTENVENIKNLNLSVDVSKSNKVVRGRGKGAADSLAGMN